MSLNPIKGCGCFIEQETLTANIGGIVKGRFKYLSKKKPH